MRTRIPLLLLALLLTGIQPMRAEHILTNSDIIDLVKAKIPDSVIVDEIQRSKCNFTTAPQDLINLKKAGVSDALLGAMVKAGEVSPATKTPVIAAANHSATLDVGVYYRKNSSWVTLPPEVVNWKTGGVLKSMATINIVKGDINGDVRGKDSPTSLATPEKFLFVVPEGTYITEYQLIHLHQHSNRRAFRTVTGGVFHVSGGATRDVVPFRSEKVGSRTFEVTIDHLDSGEYGFLPPGNNASRQAMSSLGSMYTFHVTE